MTFWPRLAAIALTASLAVVSVANPASARDRYWGHGGWGHHHRGGDVLAAGIIGLTLGAVIGGALSEPRHRYYEERYYYDPPPPPRRYRERVYRERAYRSYGPPPEWSPEWYDYCEARYESFDPRSGTYIGADRRLHYCQ